MNATVRWVLHFLTAVAVFSTANALAGPPFLTDDPEPVGFGHWEIYGAFQWEVARHIASGTCPHIEVNYGALPGLQLHAVVPTVVSWAADNSTHAGLGDIELGAKFRFLEEKEWRPQIGVFPIVTLSTGSKEKNLGAGRAQALLPLWIQASFGSWTSYGGGGVRLAANGNGTVVGWLVQRKIWSPVTLGVEAYVTIPFSGGAVQTQVNTGLIVDFTDRHHLLLSGGPSFGTDAREQAYLGYLLTL